jgi:hypothetical protein
MGGDVTIDDGARTEVIALRGRAIEDAAPANGEVYVWVAANNRWEPGSAGGGGSITISQSTINFGANTQTEYNAALTVSDAAITATSKILISVSGESTADHSADEVMAENITVVYANLVNGVSFDILARCDSGTWGQYKINYTIDY